MFPLIEGNVMQFDEKAAQVIRRNLEGYETTLQMQLRDLRQPLDARGLEAPAVVGNELPPGWVREERSGANE
jgi:hypothetical protein